MVYDLRPRIRHWIGLGSLFSVVAAIGLTALLGRVTLAVVASVALWFVLNLAVLWGEAQPRTSILTAAFAAATLFAQSQTASPVNIMLYTVMVMTVIVTVRWQVSTILVAIVGLGIVTFTHPVPPENAREWIPFLIVFPIVFIYFLGLAVRQTVIERLRVETLMATVSEQNERLRISNEQLDRMAAREERMRIARDLHDRLGHALMTINVYLRVLEDRSIEDEQMAKAAARALEATERAMRELRQSVGLLRDSQAEPMLASAIKQLVAALPRPPAVEIQIAGTPRRVDPVKEVILFRVLQEALTNIAKHARASEVAVELAYRGDALALSVVDDGVGAAELDHGYGLRGLSERLDQAGGELTLASRPGQGFCLTAKVPVPSAQILG